MRKDGQSVRGNFGENTFSFDIAKYIDDVIHQVSIEIIKTNIKPINTRINSNILEVQLIKDYLLYNVMNLN